ncbi:hypothetical protein NIES2101_41720 [Calothrix sp. HK-06]|nr:hypothetical protein NIES2101_41720 [Calothrix sp. HK-06]
MGKYKLRWFKRTSIINNLIFFQDLIVICVCFALFGAMIIQLADMFHALIYIRNPQEVTSDTLILLILVELFRLLVTYLEEHRISVEVAVEVAIVSILREVIVRGLLEFATGKIVAIGVFLLALAILLRARPWSFLDEKIDGHNSDAMDEENSK